MRMMAEWLVSGGRARVGAAEAKQINQDTIIIANEFHHKMTQTFVVREADLAKAANVRAAEEAGTRWHLPAVAAVDNDVVGVVGVDIDGVDVDAVGLAASTAGAGAGS
jgi:hypothetical protein